MVTRLLAIVVGSFAVLLAIAESSMPGFLQGWMNAAISVVILVWSLVN
jgi:uncharacterized membrane protein